MTRWIVCFAAALFLTGCGEAPTGESAASPEPSAEAAGATEVTTVAFNTAGAPTVVFEAPGMHCEMCSAGVCKTLRDAEGVVDVKADAETKLVTVAIDESTFAPETVIDAIAEANFGEATLVSEESAEESVEEGPSQEAAEG